MLLDDLESRRRDQSQDPTSKPCFVESIMFESPLVCTGLNLEGLPKLSYLIDSLHLRDFRAEIECENPNQHLYEFSGNLRIDGEP